MKPAIFYLLFALLPLSGTTQRLVENFDDGDFNNDPAWFGDTARFVITSGELQLRDLMPAANNTSYLAVAAPSSAGQATTWEFYVRLLFPPSTTNFARVYLASTTSDLTGPLNGYFIRVGGISGDTDALELFRQTGTNTTLLISGETGAVAFEPATARVRVTRSAAGEWQVYADYSGGTDFAEQGAPVIDATHPSGAYMGVYCRYTSTRAQSFFFDDFLVDPLFSDTAPPVLLSAQAENATQVLAVFNEPLDAGTAPVNFVLDPGSNVPIAAEFAGGDPSQVRLTFSSPLVNLQNYTLVCTGIRDEAGNEAGIMTAGFTFFDIQPAMPGDIIVTEFMADPSPVVSVLPDAEYIELYNRSNKVIQLQDLRYSTGGSPQALPGYLLLPGSYVIVCHQNQAAAFAPFGDVAPINSFPALVNGGDEIILLDAQGEELFYLEYDLSWYRDPAKIDGGWSIEMINTGLAGNCPGNWRASTHPRGGTPGAPNSVQGTPGDDQGPLLLNAAAISPSSIRLRFDEPLLEGSIAPGLFSISDGIQITSATVLIPASQVLLSLAQPLQPRRAYTLTVSADIKDCLGNAAGAARSLRTGLAESIEPGDVVVNEILFNPFTGGRDFVELYNRSGKIVNLNGLRIQNTQRSNSASSDFLQDYFLFPGEHVAISDSPADILSWYEVPDITALVGNSIPAFDDGSGNVTISVAGVVIDAFDYLESMHSPLLDIKDGVSLERLDPSGPSNSAGNWHSAAATVGFATPGYRNSQFRQAPGLVDGIISLPNKTFSPDGDGFEDILQIFYTVDKPGFVLNLRIFDAQGRLVRNLLRNELLASSGIFKWDGVNEEGAKARTGIYILWIELFHPDGQVERVKKTCVLAGRKG